MTPFTLSKLPFDISSLEPHMSRETLEYHWGKHHNSYVQNLNALIAGTEFEGMSLEDIICKADGGIFNNAAQVFNHGFFWQCLSPEGGGEPEGSLRSAIEERWGSFEAFREAFTKSALSNFGSGWTWLVKNEKGELDILNTSNADTPIRTGLRPLLTIDVWEHAYYIDHRNARPAFLKVFFEKLVNWDFVRTNFEA